MSKKRSRNPELRAFGSWLANKRGKARTREQISIALEKLGVPLGGSTLAQYEKGTVWAPDPGVLWGLARIYKEPLETVIRLLTVNRKVPVLENADDLLRHASTGQQFSHPMKGESDVPASARALEQRNRRDKDFATEIYAAIARLTAIATTLAEEADEAAKPTSGGAPRHRKTG